VQVLACNEQVIAKGWYAYACGVCAHGRDQRGGLLSGYIDAPHGLGKHFPHICPYGIWAYRHADGRLVSGGGADAIHCARDARIHTIVTSYQAGGPRRQIQYAYAPATIFRDQCEGIIPGQADAHGPIEFGIGAHAIRCSNNT
jgi:hypothetical protein